jgi:hypothetical protein
MPGHRPQYTREDQVAGRPVLLSDPPVAERGRKLVLSLATSELVAYKSTCSYNWTCSYNLPLATGYRLAANPPEVANPGKTMAAGKPVLAVDPSVAGTGEKDDLSVATSELVAYKSTCSYK